MHHIQEAGFEGVIRCGYIQLDHGLITALVERWRPETHTFHFPIGEATITLQDVEVLWGLQVIGSPVCAADMNKSLEQWIDICETMMGFTPPDGAISNNRILLRCLYDIICKPLPENASDESCIQRARVYILYLLGGNLLSDLSGSTVYMHHLINLVDMSVSASMSWGSAILACLYRRLCKASYSKANEICGPLVLLQLWAWERLPTIQPIRRTDEVDFTRPYGSRWNVEFGVTRVPMHVLPAYRDAFASLQPNQFIWLPYEEHVLELLPSYCTRGRACWRSVTYLICWEIVEAHLPNRVLRQFGMHQPIPIPRLLDKHVALHKMTRSGRANTNWIETHQQYIDHWRDSLNHVENGELVNDPMHASVEYMSWYWQRTVIYITNPSQRFSSNGFQGDGETTEYLMDGMCRVFYTSLDLMAISDAKHAGYFAQIRDIASHYMHQARGQQRLDIRHSHVLEQVDHQSSLTQQIHKEPRNIQRGRQGGRRCRTQPTQSHFSNIGLGGSSSNLEHGSHSDTTLPTQTPTVCPSPITPIHLFDQTLDSGITNDNAHNGGSSQLQVNDNELDEQNDITVEHHGDLPIALRKQKRTVKHIGCGTHGRLGMGH
ncbi:serine/threonine-protein phosphatase 7 long form homolog [Zingiber officinale]|uniref:serine/threonine-protein phosphatase 7 long form homolog n=1 Tax=Zingiber officinale TaxID=94328 RepID=UPI001C4DAC89|nr:serine/threonine-protein phosphatase 7 long form homolog [Zingiber officinale]